MLFNSKIFIAFSALVFFVFYSLPERARIYFLLLMSYVFYGFWDPWLLSLIILSTVVDWFCGRGIDTAAEDDTKTRQRWLGLSLAVNLGLLGFFKYHDFFVGEFIDAVNVLGGSIERDRWLLNLILPVGISFYTFQTMAYTIDIYRKEIQHDPSIVRFALYVSFFPQLVAGPVERAPHLLPQFKRPFRMSREMVREGIFLILLGFVKKVVIADRLANYIEPYYVLDRLDHSITSFEAAMSQLLFTTQIYVDFSSYSDIAIGLGLLLGYNIRPNFNLPFVVPSIPERWRRWHISMSHWFRDYIFIPLGGSRQGKARTRANIMTVMFLSGLWHGASTTFVVWGLLNGLTMVTHGLIKRPLRFLSGLANSNKVSERIYFYICCWNTYCTIAAINIFFRCPDWPTARTYVDAIFLRGGSEYLSIVFDVNRWPADFIYGALFTLFVFAAHESQRYWKSKEWLLASPWRWGTVSLAMFWAVITFGIKGPQFIYYQF